MKGKYLSFLLIVIVALVYSGCESINSPNSNSDTAVISTDASQAEAHSGTTVYVDDTNAGTGDGSSSNPFNTIQEGVDHANSGDVVKLQSDFTLAEQVTISNPLTLDGNGNTVFASFTKTDNDNNSAIGIKGTSDVTVQDLTIDGSDGIDLHGINVFVSTLVEINNVSISDNRTGVVVNGSEVTVENITTSGHMWHAMNVAQGSGVTDSAILTVTGISSHADNSPLPPSDIVDGGYVPHIFIDDNSQDVTVNDVNNQYVSASFDFRDGRADVYTHFLPETKDDCMKGGWEDFGFKNQGQCIKFVNTGKDSR
jgi:hypothetical protein